MTPWKRSRFAAAALFLACAGCATKSAIPFEQGSDRNHFDIVLAEAGRGTRAFSCSVRVTDLVAKRTISAEPVEGRAGSPGTTSKVDSESGAVLDVRVEVDAAGRVATCAATVKKGGLLIASDAAKLEVR